MRKIEKVYVKTSIKIDSKSNIPYKDELYQLKIAHSSSEQSSCNMVFPSEYCGLYYAPYHLLS